MWPTIKWAVNNPDEAVVAWVVSLLIFLGTTGFVSLCASLFVADRPKPLKVSLTIGVTSFSIILLLSIMGYIALHASGGDERVERYEWICVVAAAIVGTSVGHVSTLQEDAANTLPGALLVQAVVAGIIAVLWIFVSTILGWCLLALVGVISLGFVVLAGRGPE